ncbi:hypothetical protein B9Z55_003806 [Caenorhabditis nigoni]|uniref:ATP-dependent DNA helicase n=2 Tax=Caenorhabditis nigoni TaxID=1611254 RepID=A0A2G5VS62_9PELO|nr:hypothetical protein B9Z55_003806 [Caenorhabditis nigoni]
MPCEHCPHCQELERLEQERLAEEQRQREAIAALLAQQGDNDFPLPVANPAGPNEPIPDLNEHQKKIALSICNNWKEQKLHYIQGNAQTGKTYLLNAICILMRNLLLKVEVISPSIFPQQSKPLKKIYGQSDQSVEDVDIFIIDNAQQIPQNSMKDFENKLKRTMESDEAFGGKTIIMAADFGQMLPSPADFQHKLKASLKHLTENHVAPFKKHVLPTGEDNWSQYLDMVRRSPKVAVPAENIVKSVEELLDFAYGDVDKGVKLQNSVIVAPRNADVDLINQKMFNKIRRKVNIFEAQAIGNVIRSDEERHKLRLKIGSILILEDSFEGSPKGTRVLFEDFTAHHLNCRDLATNRILDIERVKRFLAPNENTPRKNAKEEQRHVKQFPVSLGFATTVHGAQGRTYDKIGMYHMNDTFEHGQLYTAISRAKGMECWKVLL